MRAILIDDELDNLKLLTLQLGRHCPQVEVVGQYTESMEGLKGIRTLQPALVLLDIEMPVMNGFQLLEKVGDINFQLIFITAYDQYAVRAFRFSALDYLLKPVDTVDLVNAIQRAEKLTKINPQQLDLLQQYYAAGTGHTPQKMALPHAHGLVFVDIAQIIYCEADSNYTRFYLENGEQYMISKTLGTVQEVLEPRNFVRVHRQFMVNIAHIKKLMRGEGTYLLLTNGVSIPVARQQKERLMERFGWI